MKCLTDSESEQWLLSASMTIEPHSKLRPQWPFTTLMTDVPRCLNLSGFASRAAGWISDRAERMLWISNWNTDPPEGLSLFEASRRGWGENRSLFEAPGHIFNNSPDDSIILASYCCLILAFNWEGFVVAAKDREFIYLGDEYVVFSSSQSEKMNEVTALRTAFHLKEITSGTQAWT
jgi:hypothetical protein